MHLLNVDKETYTHRFLSTFLFFLICLHNKRMSYYLFARKRTHPVSFEKRAHTIQCRMLFFYLVPMDMKDQNWVVFNTVVVV